MGKKSKEVSLFFIVILLGIMFPAFALGVEYKGVDFPDEVVIDGKTCQLMGVGSYKALYIVTVEYVGFYLSEPTQNPQAVIHSEQIKRLRAHVIYNIKAKDFTEWYDKEFSKVFDYQSNPELRKKVDQYLGSFTEDFKKHDEFSVTYIPGKGTEIVVKSEKKAIIPGRDFMLAIYTLWFGPKSPTKKFMDSLLGL
ncbi:MAG: chalcone isomerase family protein [Thermodesulfobacteriota bacterium]|nr:chalcone isomerase family protein [Thermodesulfobacteriota bacterium]